MQSPGVQIIDLYTKSCSPPSFPPQVKAEYRNEIFYPPQWYDFANKPRITNWPENIQYNQEFLVSYTGEQGPTATVTSAVLVAPSSTTHSFNQNQRVVELSIRATDPYSKILNIQAPPSANHAPPQMYMLFILNGRTYSHAKWVMLG